MLYKIGLHHVNWLNFKPPRALMSRLFLKNIFAPIPIHQLSDSRGFVRSTCEIQKKANHFLSFLTGERQTPRIILDTYMFTHMWTNFFSEFKHPHRLDCKFIKACPVFFFFIPISRTQILRFPCKK